jgi:hypothetical protein
MQGRKFTAAPPAALACTPVVFPAAGDGHDGAVTAWCHNDGGYDYADNVLGLKIRLPRMLFYFNSSTALQLGPFFSCCNIAPSHAAVCAL